MATLKDRFLEQVGLVPGLTDREIANRLLGRHAPQQGVNQVARQLASVRRVVRRRRHDGKIGNYPANAADGSKVAVGSTLEAQSSGFQSEDDVKRRLQAWLEAAGWKVGVAWGSSHGIDLDAHRGTSRWIIEVKGQGRLDPQRVNYFLSVLGELLQRIEDPQPRYSIALPDVPQFRRLWARLPPLAKERMRISALFVAGSGQIEEVT